MLKALLLHVIHLLHMHIKIKDSLSIPVYDVINPCESVANQT